MTLAQPTEIRRADYRAPDYRIETVELDFDHLPWVPVDVYQKSGPLFVGGHLGGIVRFGGDPKSMGVQVNVNVMAMLPKRSMVIEPSLGFVYGF